MTAIIQVRNLTKTFKNLTAVDNLSFDIQEGEIFGLLGSNGAGKTTVLNILTGLLLPTKGEAWISGLNVKKDIEKIRQNIAIVPQEISLYDELSVLDNLKFFGKIYDKDNLSERINQLLKLFQLEDKKQKPVYQLSGGYQRRTSIAIALLANPKILFLDEPTSGIDLTTNQIIMDYIKQSKGKMTIILTTHSVKEAEKICDNVLFMHEGKIKLYGNPSYLINQYANYFGERVIIQFQGKISNEELKTILTKHKNIIKNSWTGENYFIFDTSEIGENILKVIKSIEKTNVKILNIDIKKPSLEEVFKYSLQNGK